MIAQSSGMIEPGGLFVRALNACDKASCFSVADVNVAHSENPETSVDSRFNFIRVGPFAAKDEVIIAIGLECQRQVAQLVGKLLNGGECFAGICVNEDRPG